MSYASGVGDESPHLKPDKTALCQNSI